MPQGYIDYGNTDKFSFNPAFYEPAYESFKILKGMQGIVKILESEYRYALDINNKEYRIPYALMHIADQVEESKEILKYNFNWDDEGSLPTDEFTFSNAATFVIKYALYIFEHDGIVLKTPYIDILKDGSVSVHWETEGSQLLIIFKKNNAGLAYYYAERKDNKVPLKSAIEPGKPVDEFLALWMKKNLS
jgi:hypothetical protein